MSDLVVIVFKDETTAFETRAALAKMMSTKGPRLIEAQIVQNLEPVIDAVHNSRG